MAEKNHLNAVAQLPKSTIRLLSSSQVITSVSSVVKELMENALDAGSASIDVRLEKHGLEKIEVKDDGCGIREADCTCMALPHYTSKLKSFSDLEELISYGFRGEALHSVCAVASVSITTKTSDDTTARRYKLDKCGQAVEFETVHGLKGTTVTVTDLFKNLPVRRQVMSCTKRMNEELRKVENIVRSLSVINPAVRVSLAHNKCLIWQKTAVKHLRLSVMQVFSYNLTKHLHHIIHHTNKVELEMLVPKHDCDIKSLCSGTGTEAYHLFVSKRPVRDNEIEKILSETLSRVFGHNLPPNKSILCIIAITLPPDRLDINLEPKKTKIFIKDKEEILSCLTDKLNSYYSQAVSAISSENVVVDEPKAKRKRIEEARENVEVEKTTLLEPTSEILDDSPFPNQEEPYLSDITKQNNATIFEPTINNRQEQQQTNVLLEDNESSTNTKIGSDFFSDVAMKTYPEQGINIEQNLLQESEIKQSPEVFPSSLRNEPDISELCEEYVFEHFSLPSPSESFHDDFNQIKDDVIQPNNIVKDSMLENNFQSNSKIVGSIFSPKKVDDPSKKSENHDGDNKMHLDARKTAISTSGLLKDCLDMEKLSEPQLPVLSNEHNAFDNPSLSQWSKGGLISDTGNKIMGSCVLKQRSAEAIEKQKSEENHLGANTNSHIENPISVSKAVEDNSRELILPKNRLFSFENDDKLLLNDGAVEEIDERRKKTELTSYSFSDENNKSLDLERSVSSQMGVKQMSGFTTFARQMRSHILKESPGMSFTAVAGILASKWRSLQESEKDRYNSIASSNKNKKNSKTVTKEVKKDSIKSPPCESPNHERNFITSNASMESLSRASLDVPVENSNSSVIGRIESSDIWICARTCENSNTVIGVINSQRLHEAYRFKQNMNLMELPMKPLGRSITISQRFLTEKLWKVLVSLESVTDSSGDGSLITDKRIVMNGFRIIILSKGEDVCAHLTDLALHIIDLYGVDDLQMTLELIEKHGLDSCTVAQSRCPNVVKYIQRETTKQCVQMMNHDKLNDARELENRLRMLQNDKSTSWELFYKALHVSL